MFKISISKNNILTNEVKFASEALANSWLMQEAANKSFGKNERWLSESEFSDENIVHALESRLREGMEDVTEYKFPAAYTVQITDISVEFLAQEESTAALQYLKDTDWTIIREVESGKLCPSDVKAARAAARLKVIN